jgi:hypothetical protein
VERRRDEDAPGLLFAEGLDVFWRCVVPDLDRLMAEVFTEVGGERRMTGARDANRYPEGSVTVVLEVATRGGAQEDAQGVVRNEPQYAPKCDDGAPAHCAPVGEYKYT